MTRKTIVTFISVFLAASLPMTTAAQAGKKTAIGLGILGAAVVLGAAAQANKQNKAKAKARARAKAKAQARARAKAKARARAAAKKKQAYAAAKRKAAAKKKAAYAAAKKKKAAQQRRAIAARKAAAEKRKVAVAEEKARAEAQAQAKADAEKTEGSFVSAPSTAALLTSKDVAEDSMDNKPDNGVTELAVVDDNDDAETVTDATPIVENTDSSQGDGGCKRFIPAVGLTVSVGC